MFTGCLLAMSTLVGCSGLSNVEKLYDTESDELESIFVEVEKTPQWIVVYDKDTKVMYSVADLGTGSGQFTLLVDQNGKPKLFQGKG